MSADTRAEELPIWPSVARLFATVGIFVFHFLGLIGRHQYQLSAWSLWTFCFLTGYLASVRGTSRLSWARKRYFSVMIPHWIVITPVLIANWLLHYKPVSLPQAIVTFLGGNLFLANPLYVITWYVTFVLLLYVYLLADSFVAGWQRWLLAAVGLLAFNRLGCAEYFAPFAVGMLAASWRPPQLSPGRSPATRRLARMMFRLQELCYPFFLAHGGVQLIVFKLGRFSDATVFVLSFVASWIFAMAINAIATMLHGVLSRRFTESRGRGAARMAGLPT